MEQGEVKMNTKLMITIFTLTLLLISGCRIKTATPIDESAPNNEPIKIGAVYALSGPFASYGIEEKRGLEMAALEINKTGELTTER